MTDTGYARTMTRGQPYRRGLPERHATGSDWEVLEVHQVSPPTSTTWHAAVYATADVDPGTVAQLRMRSSAAALPAVAGTGSWTVDGDGLIRDQSGVRLISAGMNGGAPLALGTFGDPTGFYRWAYEGLPNFLDIVDIWPGHPNGSPEQYPGGLVSGGRYFSATAGNWVQLEDKVWAITGTVSTAAAGFGITSPRPDHWNNRIYRMNCHLVNGPTTWSGAPTVTAATSIPQFVTRAQELTALGLVVVPEDHDMTGTNPVLPAGLVTTPTLASSSVAAGPIRDMLDFYDAMCTAFPGGGFNIWLGLPNEAFGTAGPGSAAYVDFIVTMVRHIRAKGFGGIITLPLGRWAGDLAGLARGDYNTIQTTLNGHGVGWSIVWEWHNYGLEYYVAGSGTNRPYTWAQLDTHLAQCQAAGRLPWMAEYGQAVPTGTGAAGTADATGVLLVARHDDPLGVKYPLNGTWWTTADNTFINSGSSTGYFSLTLGPGQTETTTTDRRFPWWDIDGSNLDQLTVGGRAHWDLSHAVPGATESTASGISPPVTVTGHARNIRLGFEGIPNQAQLLYVEGRRVSGTGGLRLTRPSRPSIVSAPPTSLITGSLPTGGGGGGGGGGGSTTASTVRSSFVSDAEASSFTILPSWFSPAAQPGDKIVLIGAGLGPSDAASWTWTFPGTVLTTAGGGTYNPRVMCTLVDYNAAGWTVAASGNFRAAAICLRDTVGVAASTPVQAFSPANPAAVAHDANAVGLVVNILNYTTASVTTPTTSPAAHTTVIATPLVPRQIHVASLARPTAGTYDPGAPTTGPGSEESTAFAIVAQPTATATFPAAPTVPTFNSGTAITLGTLSADIAAAVAAQPAGTHFQLIAGTYTNWSDVRPKTGMHFKGPASGTATLEGTGKVWAFRAIDVTGSSDNVTISGPVGSIKIQNYGSGTTRAEYGAIQAQPTNTSPGSTEYTYGTAQGWFIQGVELSKNGAQGIRVSDYFTLYQVTSYGHNVSNVGGDRGAGGLIHSCTLNAGGLNPATGALSNGAGAKFTFWNASGGRTDVLPSAALRPKAPIRVVSTNMAATHAGVTGTGTVGLWFDLDCQQIEIYGGNFVNHTYSGILVEGCNNIYMTGFAIDNSDGFGATNGDQIRGALTIAESTNVVVENYGILNSDRALVVCQWNRSGDWYNSNNSTFINYAWPAELGGVRPWITDDGPLPIPGPSDQSNMWCGNITLRNGLYTLCNKVILSEDANGGGMSTVGSLPLSTIHFIDNDYQNSPSILFYDRSLTSINLATWQAQPYDRDQ